jgi:hypothetical protein
MKPSTKLRQIRLISYVYEEEYCCMAGYLNLCRARGERVVDMAENFSVSPLTIWSHYRKLALGKHVCKNKKGCLAPIISELEKENAALSEQDHDR